MYFLNTAQGLRRGYQTRHKLPRKTLGRRCQDLVPFKTSRIPPSCPSLDSKLTHMLKRLRPMRYSRLRRVSVESVGDLQLAGFSQW